nr:MAG TPA: hypothetical protein [Caudoviricetes sp.]
MISKIYQRTAIPQAVLYFYPKAGETKWQR